MSWSCGLVLRALSLLLVLLVLQVIKVTNIYKKSGLTSTGLLPSLIRKDKDVYISPVMNDFAMHSN